MRSVALGLRLLRHTGRAGAIRAGSLALGVAVAVTALLALLSIPGVVDAQRERDGELLPIYAEEVDAAALAPLRAVYSTEGLDGRELTAIAVARTGVTAAERPGWLPQWPAAGEVVVSPALAELIAVDDHAAARFPQRIVGEVGRPALAAPDSLVAVIGAPLGAFDPRGGVEALGRGPDDGRVDLRAVRLVISAVAVFSLAPIAVLIATSARLSARTNERRLASLRLIGLSARHTRRVLAVETGTVAFVGAIVGVVAWALLRPVSERLGAGSLQWWADDITLSPLVIAAVVAAIVVVAAMVAVIGANPAVEQPLGARRNAQAPATSRWRLVVLGGGMALLSVSLVFAGSFRDDNAWFAVFAIGNTLTAIGLVAAVPALGRLGAVILSRLRRSPSAVLASRRLRHEPTAVGRVIAGLLIVVFSGGFAQALLVAFDHAYATTETPSNAGEDPTVLAVGGHDLDTVSLETVPGVTALVLAARSNVDDTTTVLIADCDTLSTISRPTTSGTCDDTVAQPLVPVLSVRIDAPNSAPDMVEDVLSDALATLGYDGSIGTPTPTEIFLGVSRDGSTTGGDVRISPNLIDTTAVSANTAFVALEETIDPEMVAARIGGLQPGSQVSGLDDIERVRFADTYRTFVNAAIALTLTISLAAAAMAATDRAIERRRNAAHLAALGVPASIQRRAELLTTVTPLAAGLAIAVAGAAISGSAYLQWGEPGLRLPFSDIGIILATGLVLSLVAAVVATSATTTTPSADRLRTE